ncbi:MULTISPECIES: hypothetical protein [Actinomadura]|uniref:Secreted protein n=1 Tax=Actinomadura yumaensis TaxID=111807 RepID=A0ABW2CDZ4_9ACTN|nr:hypothetical protein [Actinomadura sp. J1-007]MWK35628.1 hypothetical protein [Actinomadura sp. J1-007]
MRATDQPTRFRGRWARLSVAVLGAGVCAVAGAGGAPSASADPATLKINGARAQGGTRTGYVNVTYGCAAGEADSLWAELQFGWGTASIDHPVKPTCDGKPHTVDVPVASKYNKVAAKEKTTAHATLTKGSLSPEDVAHATRQLTLS